jgi:hypothetical protein
MTEKVRRTLLTIQKNLRKNEPKVRKMIADAGLPSDDAVVFSMAIYYDALKKLAQE